jgi:hypothetical protein
MFGGKKPETNLLIAGIDAHIVINVSSSTWNCLEE